MHALPDLLEDRKIMPRPEDRQLHFPQIEQTSFRPVRLRRFQCQPQRRRAGRVAPQTSADTEDADPAAAHIFTMPRFIATDTASVLPLAPSFDKILLTCTFTVPSVISSSAATSLFAFPIATSCKTSSSRSVNSGERMRSASFAATFGGIQVYPAATLRTQSTNCSRGTSFSR